MPYDPRWKKEAGSIYNPVVRGRERKKRERERERRKWKIICKCIFTGRMLGITNLNFVWNIAIGEFLYANGSHSWAGELNSIGYPKVRATKTSHWCRHKEWSHTLYYVWWLCAHYTKVISPIYTRPLINIRILIQFVCKHLNPLLIRIRIHHLMWIQSGLSIHAS